MESKEKDREVDDVDSKKSALNLKALLVVMDYWEEQFEGGEGSSFLRGLRWVSVRVTSYGVNAYKQANLVCSICIHHRTFA